MSIAALIRSMSEAGAPAEAIAMAVEAIESIEGKLKAQREAARDRKRKERAKSRDSHATVTAESHDTPFPSSLPPTPPNLTTHTPGDISTPARKAGDFERFWSAYPRKVGKDAARKAYFVALGKIPGHDPPGELLAALERVKATWDDAQFIPHPRTWLAQGRWQDEPTIIHLQPRQANGRSTPSDKRAAREANHDAALDGFEIAARSRWQ